MPAPPKPGSTDPRGASPPYGRPLADRPEPEGVTLQVPGRSTMDRAYDAEASTDHRWIRAVKRGRPPAPGAMVAPLMADDDDRVIEHPNRRKPASQLARLVVIVLLIASAA